MSPIPDEMDTGLFRALAETACGMEAWLGADGRLKWVNAALEQTTGYGLAECLASPDPVELLVHEPDRSYARDMLGAALAGKAPTGRELRWQTRDGKLLWVALDWQAVRPEDGTPAGLHLSIRDIHEQRQAEMRVLEIQGELRRAQVLQMVYLQRRDEERKRLEALLDVMQTSVLFFDNDHRVVYCNRACLELMGLPPDTHLVGVRDQVIMETWAGIVADQQAFEENIQAVLASHAPSGPQEILFKDGRIIEERTAPVPGSRPNRPSGRVWLHEDVTEQRRAAARLIELAERDSLTRLLNRRRFHEELERMLAEADRRHAPLGLLAIDLDDFKNINDRFGHQAGDLVLSTLAQAVNDTVRKNEIFFRLGGDEFAILAPDSGNADMLGLARRVTGIIVEQRWNFAGQETGITASLGIAIYPQDADDGEQLIAHADAAMYTAKNSGRNTWHVYGARPADDGPNPDFR